MHARLAFVALLLATPFVAGCPKGAEPASVTAAPDPAPAAAAEERVCCESFGYGAMMAKCCEAYSWTAPDACVVEDGIVGGGKAIVTDDKCAAVVAP
ncbi:MAG: hypothetical protein V4850_29335 [Myxococcota bacterium]